jgi:hypothetical protein
MRESPRSAAITSAFTVCVRLVESTVVDDAVMLPVKRASTFFTMRGVLKPDEGFLAAADCSDLDFRKVGVPSPLGVPLLE